MTLSLAAALVRLITTPETTLAMFPSRPHIGTSALCLAAKYGNLNYCRELVSIGTDIDLALP